MRHRAASPRPGKAAKSSPSMASTRPSATRKSDIAATAPSLCRSAALPAGRRRPRRRPDGAASAAFEPSRPCRTDRRSSGRTPSPACSTMRVSPRLHAGLVGLHRAVEGEEVRILAEGLGEDAVALGVALAADLLGLARCASATSTVTSRSARRGFPATAGCPGRGTRPPRADARSACAGTPPGCSAPADRRGGSARRPP